MAQETWKVLGIETEDGGMFGATAEVKAEKDGKTVFVTMGATDDGYNYVVSEKGLIDEDGLGEEPIAEYPSQKAALASEYGPLFRKAIAAFRKI